MEIYVRTETEAEMSQWAEGWRGTAWRARGFRSAEKSNKRTAKKSPFSLHPHRSPHPSLAHTGCASTEEERVRADHRAGSTHYTP